MNNELEFRCMLPASAPIDEMKRFKKFELQAKMKELKLALREINQMMAARRAKSTMTRIPTSRYGGITGALNLLNRYVTNNDLIPLETKKLALQGVILKLEQALIQVDGMIANAEQNKKDHAA